MAFRWVAALVSVAGLATVVVGQERRAPARPEEEYRQQILRRAEQEYREFYKRPESVPEYWSAIKYEMEVGRFGLAAQQIHELLALTKDDAGRKALLDIEEEEGLTAFLRLRVVPSWVNDPNLPAAARGRLEREARADVEELISRVTDAVRRFLADPVRINKLIGLLPGSQGEYRYALTGLQRSGATAVPYLIATLQKAQDTHLRETLLDTLVALGGQAVPPLLAALDTEDAGLQIELIDVLERRAERGAVPWLWYPAAAGDSSVRRSATGALVRFLGVSADRLPPAKVALTEEANRYYQHAVSFPRGETVTVWRWEAGRLVSQPMSASAAEEYYGLRFARQALLLDPAYEPAQVVFLSTALEKDSERGGLGRTLQRESGPVRDLARSVNPDLVIAVLDRALRENRLPVILGALWTLGDLGEPRAARPDGRRPPVLLRALNYPDRRVQIAAADALLRLPGVQVPGAHARIVEVLRRSMAADSQPTVVVADANVDRGEATAHAVQQAGYAVVTVSNGRDVLRQLADSGSADAILVDVSIPAPELPYLLGQIRADVNAAHLPVLVGVPRLANGRVDEEREARLGRLFARDANVSVVTATTAPAVLKQLLGERIASTQGRVLTADERRAHAALALMWLRRMAAQELPGYDVRPAESAVLDALQTDELAEMAADAAAHLPGRAVQRRLADLVLNPSRSPSIRAAAAVALARHLGQFGPTLTSEQVSGIESQYQAARVDGKEPRLRAALAQVLGSMRPDARRTGLRLEGYAPAPPKPTAPTPDKSDTDR